MIVATVTMEMTCPSTAARVAGELGATPAGAFDMTAACCGFLYAMNMADSIIRAGRANRIGIVGCDWMSSILDYDDRTCSILFGDAAGSAILEATEDPAKGSVYQSMHADGRGWPALYIPRKERDLAEGDPEEGIRMGCLRMNGGRSQVRGEPVPERHLERVAAELQPDEIGSYIYLVKPASSKASRSSDSPEKVYVNIDEYGNSSAGSVGLCLDEIAEGLIDGPSPPCSWRSAAAWLVQFGRNW